MEEDATRQNEAERAKIRAVTVGGEEDIRYQPDLNRLATHLGLDNNKILDNKEKLTYLLQWAENKANSKYVVDVLFEVKKLKDSMGFNEIGETSLKKLYSYLRLSEDQSKLFNDLKRIKKEKELLKDANPSREHPTSN